MKSIIIQKKSFYHTIARDDWGRKDNETAC